MRYDFDCDFEFASVELIDKIPEEFLPEDVKNPILIRVTGKWSPTEPDSKWAPGLPIQVAIRNVYINKTEWLFDTRFEEFIELYIERELRPYDKL